MKVCAKGTKTIQAQNSKVATLKLQRYLTGVQRAGPLGSPSSGGGFRGRAFGGHSGFGAEP